MNYNPKSIFISHGGGPLPLLGDDGHRQMVSCLKNIASKIPRPDAIVVVSAHWEEQVATITAAKTPRLIYDYHGFPDECYQIQYPCIGEPSLAKEIHKLLKEAMIESRLDEDRGFDHGLFVPLKIMYPEADIPCIQLSLLTSLDPAGHIEVGKALRSLSSENILLIGSGFSFHNLRDFFATQTAESQEMNLAFEKWLQDTCCRSAFSEQARTQMLNHWQDAPGAHFCHPREEHLLPLHVCYGVAQAPCSESFALKIMNKVSSMYLW